MHFPVKLADRRMLIKKKKISFYLTDNIGQDEWKNKTFFTKIS